MWPWESSWFLKLSFSSRIFHHAWKLVLLCEQIIGTLRGVGLINYARSSKIVPMACGFHMYPQINLLVFRATLSSWFRLPSLSQDDCHQRFQGLHTSSFTISEEKSVCASLFSKTLRFTWLASGIDWLSPVLPWKNWLPGNIWILERITGGYWKGGNGKKR